MRPPAGPEPSQGFVDLRQYLAVLRESRRLITILALGTLLLAAAYSFTRTNIYQATSKVAVKPVGVDLASAAAQGPEKLVSMPTEAELVTSTEVATLARTAMGATASPQSLVKHVTVKIPSDTALVLDITYTDKDPDVAQAGAEAFAESYLQYKQQGAVADIKAHQDALNRDIEDLRQQLADTPRQFHAAIQAQIATDRSKISDLSGIATDPGRVISVPGRPQQPTSPNHKRDLLLGLFLGLTAGVVTAFVRNQGDDRLRERTQLEDVVGAPVMAIVPRDPGWVNRGQAKLAAVEDPQSPTAEAYRTLRPSLLVAAAQGGVKSIMVVSPLAGEGKTTTAANLAVLLAQAGRKVSLISADLRKPRLHEFFGMRNDRGLTDVLMGQTPPWESLKRTTVDNLWLLPSGSMPPNPAELLQSREMEDLVEEQRRVVDFIIFDCPPILAVADSLGMVQYADAVLFVADAASTKLEAVAQARAHLDQVGATIIGAVLNDFDTSSPSYYGYGYADESVNPNGAKHVKGRAAGILRRLDPKAR